MEKLKVSSHMADKPNELVIKSLIDPGWAGIKCDTITLDVTDNCENKLNIENPSKILVIEKCASVEVLLELLEENWLRNFLTRSSHCFVIAAKISKKHLMNFDQFLEKFKTNHLKERPLIIELFNEQSNECQIFYKNFDQAKLEVLKFGHNQHKDLLHKLISSENLNGTLLDCKINLEEEVQGKSLIQLASESNDALAVRFLKLFLNSSDMDVLELAAKQKNPRVIAALLDTSIRDDGKHILVGHELAEMLTDEYLKNLTDIANNHGSKCTADFIARIDIFKGKLKIVQEALQERDFERLLELLSNDHPIPDGLEKYLSEPEDNNKIVDDLKILLDERLKFHQSIRGSDLNAVKNFVEDHPGIKIGYGLRNEPALLVAVEALEVEPMNSDACEVYAYILHSRFKTLDDEYQKRFNKLSDKVREKVNKKLSKSFKPSADSHLKFILSKCQLGGLYNELEKSLHFQTIECWLKKLDGMGENIRSILKIIEAAETSLTIVFDFDRKSTSGIDLNTDDLTMGICYFVGGKILIGAKGDEAEIMGTVIHELCHYAMQILFNNNAQPFEARDWKNRREFEVIKLECQNKTDNIPIVGKVFSCYDYKVRNAELIVRVPEMITFYHDKPELQNHLETYEKLVTFYQEHFIWKIKEHLIDQNSFQVFRKVRQLNESLGRISKLPVVKDRIIELPDNSDRNLIVSEIPEFTVANLIASLKTNEFILLTSDDLKNGLTRDKISSLSNKSDRIKIVICWNAEDKVIAEHLPRTFCLICGESSAKAFRLNLENFQEHPEVMRYCWKDIDESLIDKLRITQFKLQGRRFKLSEIFRNDLEAMQNLPLAPIFNGNLSSLDVQSKFSDIPVIYITRTFKCENKIISENDVLLIIEDKRKCLIADGAGMGKTTVTINFAHKLKQRNPISWVVFIDLKQHIEDFCEDGNPKQPETVQNDFFIDKILKLSSELEMKLFEYFYETGKMIFIVDGFDEISPIYANFVLKILANITKSKNFLVVTTRNHLTELLQKALGVESINLQPFDYQDQVIYLVDFWRISRPETDKLELEKLAESLATALSNTEYINVLTGVIKLNNILGTPLQVHMLAEIYDTKSENLENLQNFNLYSLYRSFVVKKIDVLATKGALAQKAQAMMLSSSYNVFQFHQIAALQYLFGQQIVSDLNLSKIENQQDLFSRIGLVQIDGNGNCTFVHQTIAEFFAADFIVHHLVMEKTHLSASSDLHKLFLRVLLDVQNERLRKFMNDKIETLKEFETITLSMELEKSLQRKDNQYFISLLVIENQKALINLLLRDLNYDPRLKWELVLNSNALATTVFFKSEECFDCLWSCIEEITEKEERKQLLFAEDSRGKNILHYASILINLEVLKKILKVSFELMNKEEFVHFLLSKSKNGPSGCDYDMGSNHKDASESFKIKWDYMKKVLSIKQLKSLLFIEGGHNTLTGSFMSQNENTFDFILTTIKALFNKEELVQLLSSSDSEGKLVLHTGAALANLRCFTNLWEFVQENTHDKIQKELWLQQDHFGFTIILSAVGNLNKEILEKVLAVSKRILNDQEFEELLLRKSHDGNNALFIAATVPSRQFIRILKELENFLNGADLKNLFLERGQKDMNIFDLFEENHYDPNFLPIFEYIEKIFSKSEIVKHTSKKSLKFRLLPELSKFSPIALESFLSRSGIKFSEIIEFASVSQIEKWFKVIREKLDRKSIHEILFEIHDDKHYILRSIVMNQDQEAVRSVWNFFVDNLEVEQMKLIILSFELNKNEFLHLSTSDLLITIFKWVTINSTRDEQITYFFCMIEIATSALNAVSFQKCLDFVLRAFGTDGIREALISKQISFRALKRQFRSSQIFWKNAKDIFSEEEIESLNC